MVFKYTTSYLMMICYFNYAWLLVLGVGCRVSGVGLACATRRQADRQAGRQARRQQLACAMLGYGYGYGCGLPRAILG